IRKITPDAQVTIIAGVYGQGGIADGAGPDARFSFIEGLAADSVGNLYVMDAGNSNVRKITPDGQVSTFAGATGESGSTDGLGTAAKFNGPSAIAVDAADNVYVVDTYNYTIRKITPDGQVTTIAGLLGQNGVVDGPVGQAQLGTLGSAAVDAL